MPVRINSSGWIIRKGAPSRGASRTEAPALEGLPAEFLARTASVADEVVLEPAPRTRGRALEGAQLDISYDLAVGKTAVLAVRHASGALTFHLPVDSLRRGLRKPSQVRFLVSVSPSQATTRGLAGQAVKAIVIAIGKVGLNKAVSLALPALSAALERAVWKKRGLAEGWLRVTRQGLADGTLEPGRPAAPLRSLLFIHGTFSHAAAAFRDLAASPFFDRLGNIYGDRIYAFDHFTISRTPEENARMLLGGLPEQPTTFDVVTHSRGGLVLRALVERADSLGPLARRFVLGRAVLVASPNEGTPLATPERWSQTVGWLANLLEVFPDNPFTTGAELVANGLVWLAHHVAGDLPGLRSMDADGPFITTIQRPPGPPAESYSALVSNYHPTGALLPRLLDAGLDQFFGSANDLVVPSAGGWRIDGAGTPFVSPARIGCFGPGGNLTPASVSHVHFFSQPATVDFLVNALGGQRQPLVAIDPRLPLPDRRVARGIKVEGAPRSTAPDVSLSRQRRRKQAQEPEAPPLRITVTNGDLTFEPEALLIGHYVSTRLTGSERVMDTLIGGAMGRALELGLYPRLVGSHEVFINTRADLARGSAVPRPRAVVVVGLGREGTLKPADLVTAVRQAVVAWAQQLAEKKERAQDFRLASTLMGSGGMGISAGEAARLIAQGLHDANTVLREQRTNGRRWPIVRHLRLIELYLDRATDAWRTMRLQEAATPGRFVVDETIQQGTGSLQRPPDSGYRGADFDFISIETKEGDAGEPLLAYTLDTRRARSEVRGQRTQGQLVRDLVAVASNDQSRDHQIGRTLFHLLVPAELEPYLAGSGEVHMELDLGTAAIPWELLDTTSEEQPDQRPWAIRTKLLRKLRLAEFREHVVDPDPDASVLIVGEPACPANYPRLYGARAEAAAVRDCLLGPGALAPDRVTALVSDDPLKTGPDAREVVTALFEKPWRIVHLAGHGAPPEGRAPRGVVLSNGSFLGPDEIRAMRTTPELVFVNCCHLAAGDAADLLVPPYDRASFASGVAGALIDIGVRCVVAAGWAVDDEAAAAFAAAFYTTLLQGTRFIDAVGSAREAAYRHNPQSNTWAAYQCYGDPDWTFRTQPNDANQLAAPRAKDFSDVASDVSLKLELSRIIVQTKYQNADRQAQIASIRALEGAFGPRWGGSGSVAELFGEAFVHNGAIESGLSWYERAVAASDGTASLRAAEQLCNVRARLAWQLVDAAHRHRDHARQVSSREPKPREVRAALRQTVRDADRKYRESFRAAHALTESALSLLNTLRSVGTTLERESLLGSLYMRRALIDTVAGRPRQAEAALARMKRAYAQAEAVGRRTGALDLYYPAANRLAADAALNAGRRGWTGLDAATVRTVQESLQAQSGDNASFWSVVGHIELRQYMALADESLGRQLRQFESLYKDLHERVPATRMWASVHDAACLVLGHYCGRVASRREREAARTLLHLLRTFAQPDSETGGDG